MPVVRWVMLITRKLADETNSHINLLHALRKWRQKAKADWNVAKMKWLGKGKTSNTEVIFFCFRLGAEWMFYDTSVHPYTALINLSMKYCLSINLLTGKKFKIYRLIFKPHYKYILAIKHSSNPYFSICFYMTQGKDFCLFSERVL